MAGAVGDVRLIPATDLPVVLRLEGGHEDLWAEVDDPVGSAQNMLGLVARIPSYEGYVSGCAAPLVTRDVRPWSVVAFGKQGNAVAKLRLLTSGDRYEGDASYTLADRSDTLDVGFFADAVDGWLTALFDSMQSERVNLAATVEVLLLELRNRIIENDELLDMLDERDAFIEQLEGQIRALEAELRRRAFDPERAEASVAFIKRLFTTARVTALGTALTAAATLGLVAENAHQPSQLPARQPLVEIQGGIGDHARVVINVCDSVMQQSESFTGPFKMGANRGKPG